MYPKQPLILLLASVFLVAACSSKNIVVLVADPDGTVGRITVANQAGRVEIDTANQAATLKDRYTAPGPPVELEKEEINSLFLEALAIQPMPPIHFMLYFERESAELKPESYKVLDAVLLCIQQRYSEYITITGHTDTLGEKNYNYDLSRQRALAVKELLIKRGVKKESIETLFHGEENLLIQTGDNISNPKNRRAEVVVR
jgi:outer membrane protein OmpA-like peptidoglycan-associated protein